MKPAETVAETATPEPQTAKAPDISIHEAVKEGNVKAPNNTWMLARILI